MKTQISNLKSQIYSSKLKTFFFVILVLSFAFCLLSLAPRLAQSQSPTPEPTAGEEISQEIKEKVQERIEAITETKLRKVAYFGNISNISGSVITVNTKKGEKAVNTDEETKFIGKSNQEIKLADLKIGNFVIAMGNLDPSGSFLGKRILVLAKQPEIAPARLAVHGKVVDISQEEKIISLKHLKQDLAYEIEINDKTTITKKMGEKITKVKFEDIEIGDRIVAIGTKEKENGTITAKIVHVIPGLAKGLEKVTPTPKPSPKATPKLSPTPTKEPTE